MPDGERRNTRWWLAILGIYLNSRAKHYKNCLAKYPMKASIVWKETCLIHLLFPDSAGLGAFRRWKTSSEGQNLIIWIHNGVIYGSAFGWYYSCDVTYKKKGKRLLVKGKFLQYMLESIRCRLICNLYGDFSRMYRTLVLNIRVFFPSALRWKWPEHTTATGNALLG